MSKNDRITFTLSVREAELLAYAVDIRRHQLIERARTGDHRAADLASEYEPLSEQMQRIYDAVDAHLAQAA